MSQNLRSLTLAGLTAIVSICTNAAYADERGADTAPVQESLRSPEHSGGDHWTFELGGGAMYSADYEGSDNYGFQAIPQVAIDYKNGLFFVRGADGIGTYPIRGDRYLVGAQVGYTFGRDEDDNKEDLRGMGDIDSVVVVDLIAEYSIGPLQLSGKISKGEGDYGTTASVDIGTLIPVNKQLIVTASVGTTWADDDYMQTHFGVSALQSTRSGYRQYEAQSGIKSSGVSAAAIYSISANWDVMFMASGDILLGEAKDSPLIKDDFQPAAFLTTSYKFNW